MNTDKGSTPVLLTRKQVAAALSVTLPTVARLVKDGKLEEVQLGYRSYRITQASLTNYVESLRRKPEGAS